MYSRCLKNYGYLLRYVFFVLGVIFLSILLGGHIFMNKSKAALEDMVDNISGITKNADLSFDDVSDAIISTLNDLSFDEQVNEVKDNGISGATDNLIEDAVEKVVSNYE